MMFRRVVVCLEVLAVVSAGAAAVTMFASGGASAGSPPQFALGFGSDTSGQAGVGTTVAVVSHPAPVDLPAGVSAVQVAPGYSHSLALGSDGRVYAWGANEHGELGNGGTTASTAATPVKLPSGIGVTAVSAGYLDSFALTSTGTIYAWGYDAYGELGDGGLADVLTPALVQLPSGVSAKSVSAGYAHTVAVTSGGAVYAWGYNALGQLGDGTTATRYAPVRVNLPAGTVATGASAGYAHSLAVTDAGKVYAWGYNNKGQLGNGTTTTSATPAPVALGTVAATAVSAGYLHSVAVLADGSVRTWGDNSYGQLGTGQPGSALSRSTTPLAAALGGATATGAVAGFGHTLVLTAAGTVLGAGDNSYGELGTGDTTAQATPTAAVLPAGATAVAVSASGYSLTSFVLVPGVVTTTTLTSGQPSAPQGQAVTFTANVSPTDRAGTLSFSAAGSALPGCTALPLRPLPGGGVGATCSTAALPVGTTAVGATYSGGHEYLPSTGALDGDQTVTAAPTGVATGWGANTYGELGNGTTSASGAPAAVSFPAGVAVRQLAAGFGHGLALLTDGSVYAWGDNSDGELGDATTTSSAAPVAVHLPSGVTPVSVAAGVDTSAVLASDGALYTFGLNSTGQLGDGTTTNRSTPVPVRLPAGTAVTAVSLGYAHLLAMTSTGQVYAAGQNKTGQLGDGNTLTTPTPARVLLPAGVAVTGVAAGNSHSLALTTDGTVLAWGDDARGELGDNGTTPATTPQAVTLPAGTQVSALAAGNQDSFALTAKGAILAWGDGTGGQLGTGTGIDAGSPTPVALPDGSTAVAVAAGAKSGYALTAGGAVLAWGDDSAGELGDGSTTTQSAPVAVHLPAGGTAVGLAAGSDVSAFAIVPRISAAVQVAATPNPSVINHSVTFTATVGPADGGGTVTFTADDAAISGCQNLALSATDTATCSTSGLAVGTHTIVADYSGDRLYVPGSGALDGGQVVNLPPTTTKVSSSAAKISYGKSVTFTATVSGGATSGTVAFAYDGTTIAGCSAVALANKLGTYKANCATTALPYGQHTITATYSGNDKYAGSTGTLAGGETVQVATKLVATAVTVTGTTARPTYRAVLTAATDSAPVAGATVTFTLNPLYGSSSCTAVTDAQGVASCTAARPNRSGPYTAKFAGTAVYLASSGSSTVTVN